MVKKVLSNVRARSTGVTQGYTLGPLLFLLYVNDFPSCLENTTPGMYADDTQLTAVADTIEELEKLLNQDIKNVKMWLNANKLSANATKTEFMIVGSKYRLKQLLSDPNILIDKNTIKRVSKTKLLGVMIDEKLTWENHIEEIVIPKVLKGLRMIRTLRPILNLSQRVKVYESLVLPHFDYCSTVWGNCGSVLRGKLQKLQNRAARIITFSGYEVRSSDILSFLGWYDLETRRKNQKCSFMYKVMNDLVPSYLRELFVIINQTHEHNLRCSDINLKIPQPHTNYLKRSFAYSGAVLWNDVPLAFKQAPSVNVFNNYLNL